MASPDYARRTEVKRGYEMVKLITLNHSSGMRWLYVCVLSLCFLCVTVGCSNVADQDIYRRAALLDTEDFQEMLAYEWGTTEVLEARLADSNIEDRREIQAGIDYMKERQAEVLPKIEQKLPAINKQLQTMAIKGGDSPEDYRSVKPGWLITHSWDVITYNWTPDNFTEDKWPNGPVTYVRPELNEALRVIYTVFHLIRAERYKEAEAFFEPGEIDDWKCVIWGRTPTPPDCTCQTCIREEDTAGPCTSDEARSGIFLKTFREKSDAWLIPSRDGLFAVQLLLPSYVLPENRTYPLRMTSFEFVLSGHTWGVVKSEGRWRVWFVHAW
jgi:hypothetical protein